jgi:PST family polysaccharide transporter
MPLVQYLVAHPQEGPREAFHVTVTHLGLGALVVLGALAFVGPASEFFGVPTMATYAPGFALALMLDRLGSLAERVLARDLQFRALALGRGVGELTYTAAALGCAVAGLGGMSIVYANVGRGLVTSVLLVGASRRSTYLRVEALDLDIFRRIFRYGLPLTGSYFAAILSRRWDNMIVTKLYGPGVAGLYNLAFNLADVPAIQVAEQIGDVLMPSLAHMDKEARQQTLTRVAGLLGLLVFPLATGLGAVAFTVEKLFSDKWQGLGPMLAILASMSVARPLVTSLLGPFLQVSGRTKLTMVLSLVQLVLLAGGLLTLGRMGPLWACVAVGLASAGHAMAALAAAHRFEGLPVAPLLLRVVWPLVPCIPMALAVAALPHALATWSPLPPFPPLPLAVVQVALGALVYGASTWLVARSLVVECVATVREARAHA